MNLENLRTEEIARIVLRVAFIILGVYLLVRAILVFFDFAYQGVAQVASSADGGDWVRTLVYLVSLLVTGGLLVTFSRRLASSLYKSERPALAKQEPEPSAVCPSCGRPYTPGDYDPEAPEWQCARCGARLGP